MMSARSAPHVFMQQDASKYTFIKEELEKRFLLAEAEGETAEDVAS